MPKSRYTFLKQLLDPRGDMDELAAHPFLESQHQEAQAQAQPTQKNKFSIRDFTLTSAFEQLTDLGLPDLIGKVYRHWQHSPL